MIQALMLVFQLSRSFNYLDQLKKLSAAPWLVGLLSQGDQFQVKGEPTFAEGINPETCKRAILNQACPAWLPVLLHCSINAASALESTIRFFLFASESTIRFFPSAVSFEFSSEGAIDFSLKATFQTFKGQILDQLKSLRLLTSSCLLLVECS